jgi:hypothetical protein
MHVGNSEQRSVSFLWPSSARAQASLRNFGIRFGAYTSTRRYTRCIMDAATNLQNMKKLDDSWNAQDLQTFRKYHANDCIVRWPNQPPTHGIDAHEQEAIAFFKTFPDQHLINNPYKIMLAQGEWTCLRSDNSGHPRIPSPRPPKIHPSHEDSAPHGEQSASDSESSWS